MKHGNIKNEYEKDRKNEEHVIFEIDKSRFYILKRTDKLKRKKEQKKKTIQIFYKCFGLGGVQEGWQEVANKDA